jgi:hypothetical protein
MEGVLVIRDWSPLVDSRYAVIYLAEAAFIDWMKYDIEAVYQGSLGWRYRGKPITVATGRTAFDFGEDVSGLIAGHANLTLAAHSRNAPDFGKVTLIRWCSTEEEAIGLVMDPALIIVPPPPESLEYLQPEAPESPRRHWWRRWL